MMRRTISGRCATCAIILALCFAAPVAAGPFEDAAAAYAKRDYATAMRLWRPLADQGYAMAQFSLGVMYDFGRGVPQDKAVAVSWYRKAADQGEAVAQTNLGLIYANGQGVRQDYAAAASWFRKAADQGYAPAQFILGAMYSDGQGVPKNYAAALTWYRKAADQGDAGAQFYLGLVYEKGEGVRQDYAAAVSWYRKAADQGFANAKLNLGRMYDKGEGVPQDYAAAVNWSHKAADQRQCSILSRAHVRRRRAEKLGRRAHVAQFSGGAGKSRCGKNAQFGGRTHDPSADYRGAETCARVEAKAGTIAGLFEACEGWSFARVKVARYHRTAHETG